MAYFLSFTYVLTTHTTTNLIIYSIFNTLLHIFTYNLSKRCEGFMKNKLKILFIIVAVALFAIGSCLLINIFGLDDITKLKSIISDSWIGSILYTILLAIQIVFLPINSLILIVPAMLIFGSLKAYLLSLLGLLIGSIIAFYMGRLFGAQVISWMFGREKTEVWAKKIGANGKLMLPICFLIPIFPDELICMLAGLSNIKTSYFVLVSIITRAIDLAFTCFIGSIIPFHGWWLLLWATLLLITFLCSYWLSKHHSSIQQRIEKFIKRLSR